jgi:hypothetical protein
MERHSERRFLGMEECRVTWLIGLLAGCGSIPLAVEHCRISLVQHRVIRVVRLVDGPKRGIERVFLDPLRSAISDDERISKRQVDDDHDSIRHPLGNVRTL